MGFMDKEIEEKVNNVGNTGLPPRTRATAIPQGGRPKTTKKPRHFRDRAQ
jgi:hypothetical protein